MPKSESYFSNLGNLLGAFIVAKAFDGAVENFFVDFGSVSNMSITDFSSCSCSGVISPRVASSFSRSCITSARLISSCLFIEAGFKAAPF